MTAALLKDQGYEVFGVTMQIWPADAPPAPEGGCCSLSAVDDARRVADTLGIPYYVMNFRDLFREKVIDYFCNEYVAGKTPNPCIACNRELKFAALLQKALTLGADFLATGHYGRIIYDRERSRYLLYRATDESKDQSYVLYGFTQEQLAHTLLPLGEFRKSEIREMAAGLGLKVATKPDSQEICFVPDDDYRGYLAAKIGDRIEPGPFLNRQGEVLGQHRGLAYYTVGQRRGLGLAFGKPLYVLELDPDRNAVILGESEELLATELVAGEVNFIPFDYLAQPLPVMAKIRYKAQPAAATIYPEEGNRLRVRFDQPQRAITPGQAVVFYQEDLVIGGGTIL